MAKNNANKAIEANKAKANKAEDADKGFATKEVNKAIEPMF